MTDDVERSCAWWEQPEEGKHPHEVLHPYVRRLLEEQGQRYDNYRRLISMFEHGPRKEYQDDVAVNLDDITVQANWARRAVLTVLSKLTKTVTTPMPLTTGATWDDRDNAENLGKAIDGEFRKNKVEQLVEDVVADGLSLGDGFFFVPHGQGEIRIEWLPTEDLVIDPSEGRYRRPRSVHIRRLVDMDELLSKYGRSGEGLWGSASKRRKAIRDAARETSLRLPASERRYGQRQVEVWMSYHLPSGPDADDGRYAVVVNGGTLEFSDWDRPRFPISQFTPWKARRQFHGISMLAEISSLQREHDLCARRVQASNKRLGGTHLLVDKDALIDEEELNNGQGTRIYYTPSKLGNKPVEELHPTIANESVFGYMKGLVDQMMGLYAIPSMVMTGQPPAGLRDASGKALELADEQAAEALINQHRAKEQCLVDLAWLVVEEAEHTVEDDVEYMVDVRDSKRGLKKVRWKDVLLARGEYELDVRPAGDLARSPAARFKQCLDMLSGGVITAAQFKALFSVPDLEAAFEVDLADEEIIYKTMSAIVRHGRPLLPMSYDNLQLCVVLGRKFYNLCRVNEVEEDRLQLLDDYVQRAFDLEKRARAEAAATQLPPSGGPPGESPPGPVPGEPVPPAAA